MKKEILLLATFLLIVQFVQAQVPFTSLFKEKEYKKKYIPKDNSGLYSINYLKENEVVMKSSIAGSESNYKPLTELKDPALFFNHNYITGDLVGDNLTAKVSSNILYYRLTIYEPEKKDYRYTLPLFIVSKISSEYDSANTNTVGDVLDYDGSPITIRFMPSWEKTIGKSNKLYYGLIFDYRGINIVDDELNNQYEHGFYTSAGFTYSGKGSVTQLGTAESKPGVWNFSLMLQAYMSRSEVIKELYDTTEDYALGIQGLFNFIVSEKNPMNLRFGFNYYFTDPMNVEKFGLKLSVGN